MSRSGVLSRPTHRPVGARLEEALGHFHELSDPWRRPERAWRVLTAGVGTLAYRQAAIPALEGLSNAVRADATRLLEEGRRVDAIRLLAREGPLPLARDVVELLVRHRGATM